MANRPDKIELEFGASLSGECDLWIVSGDGEAEFKVKLGWGKATDHRAQSLRNRGRSVKRRGRSRPRTRPQLMSAGAELKITPSRSLAAKFDGASGAGSQTCAGTGILRYVW